MRGKQSVAIRLPTRLDHLPCPHHLHHFPRPSTLGPQASREKVSVGTTMGWGIHIFQFYILIK